MKMVLLGTSAIALAGAFATSANAVEWDVRVGGYFETYAAYAASDVDGIDGDWDGIDNKTDSEIHFVPAITLDNGIKFGADVQLEGNTGGDQIDESFLFVEGAFGRALFGSENSAGYLMTYAAPDVTFLNINSGSLTKFIPFAGDVDYIDDDDDFFDEDALEVGDDIFRGTLGSTFLENDLNNDVNRFTYFTPRFAGFQVGLSYARDGLQDDQSQINLDANDPEELENIFDVGANYVNSFGGIDVAASGRWGIANNEIGGDIFGDDLIDFDDDGDIDEEDEDFLQGEDNPQVWGAGLNLGYAGVTVGGSFAEQNNAGEEDGQAWDAGIAYETGPWGFSFTYLNGENVDDENEFNPLGNDEQLQQYLLGVNYTLARGVALNGFGAYADFDEEVGDAGGGDGSFNEGGDDVDGWVVGTGIKISW